MNRRTARTSGEDAGVSRRRVLVGGATAVVGAAGVAGGAGTARAQGLVTAVIPEPEQWAAEDLPGFEIRLGTSDGTAAGGGEGTGEATEDVDGGTAQETAATDTGGTDDGDTAATDGGDEGTDATAGGGDDGTPNCDVADWPPDEVETHSVMLVNRQDEDTPGEDVTLYTSADVDVEADAPYVINTAEACESDHVGLELETSEGAVEQDDDPQEVEGDGDGGQNDTPRSGEGSGAFGPGFGVPAVVAGLLGWGLLRWRNRE